MNEIIIDNIEELFRIIVEKNKDEDCWFRGQTDSDYWLCPKIFREGIFVNDYYWRPIKPRKMYGESYDSTRGFGFKFCNPYLLIEDFKRKLIKENIEELKEDDDLSIMCLGQHYGLPTQLLDWTTDALVGLYFSLPKIEKGKDSSLFILKPQLLNKNKGVPNYSDLKDCYEKISNTIAFYGPRDNPRICRQSGNFTFHGDYSYFRFELYYDTDTYLTKIIIKHELHEELKKLLNGLGTNYNSIYINDDYKDTIGKRAISIGEKQIKNIIRENTKNWEETPQMDRGIERRSYR